MVDLSRRSVVIGFGTSLAIPISGCMVNDDQEPESGSLQFRNNHTMPHVLSVKVIDGPDRVMENRTGPTASLSVEPDGMYTYERFISIPGQYEIVSKTQEYSSDPITTNFGGVDKIVQAKIDRNGRPTIGIKRTG